MTNNQGVTVTGTGAAAAAVDRVTVDLAVTESGPDGGAAFEAAARTVTQVLGVLADNGADSRSVRTTDLTLGPRTEWRDGREMLLDYQATQRLVLHLDAIGPLSRMLTEVATQVGNGVRIEGVHLVPTDPAPARAAAREAAWQDALARAQQYAQLAGRTLGPVSTIAETEQGGHLPRMAKMVEMSAAADMPIAGGDSQVSVSVTVTWALEG